MGTVAGGVSDYLSVHCWTNERGMVEMRINKYIEKIENKGFEVDVNQDNDNLVQLMVRLGDYQILHIILGENIRKAKLDSGDHLKLSQLIELLMRTKALLDTPDDVLFPEPKYRVLLVGFNSVDGKQYLTTENSNVNLLARKFFACTLNSRLKQEFTLNELTAIANKREFKAVPWIQDLLRNTELVEED